MKKLLSTLILSIVIHSVAKMNVQWAKAFIVFAMLLITGCSEVDVKDRNNIANYLQSHYFDNGNGSTLGFTNNGSCALATHDGVLSCTYSVEPKDNDYATINMPGCITQISCEWTINNDGEIFCSGYENGAYKVYCIYQPKSK